MKGFGTLLIVLSLVWGGTMLGLQASHISQQKPIGGGVPIVGKNADQEAQVGIPQHVRIPKINVDANVEEVGLDVQGRMDVPRSSENVGWYKLGYKPGEVGNAVLDGHLDKVTGAPAVFWDIDKLGPGDSIILTDSKGKEYTFLFVKMNKYPYNDFPIKEVFGPSDKPMLNLITCKGIWDAVNKNYSDRIVVTAELQ